MSDLRTAAQQALEALELPRDWWNATQYKIVTNTAKNLRTALAQEPAQPVVQEPVAWIVEFENGERELHWHDTKASLGESQVPLYVAPQPAAPQSAAQEPK